MEGFEGVSLDHATERVLEGEFAGHDWRWRKARHVDEDVAIFAEGVFVAEANGVVAGYISTRIDRDAGKGRIPNLAVAAWARRERADNPPWRRRRAPSPPRPPLQARLPVRALIVYEVPLLTLKYRPELGRPHAACVCFGADGGD